MRKSDIELKDDWSLVLPSAPTNRSAIPFLIATSILEFRFTGTKAIVKLEKVKCISNLTLDPLSAEESVPVMLPISMELVMVFTLLMNKLLPILTLFGLEAVFGKLMVSVTKSDRMFMFSTSCCKLGSSNLDVILSSLTFTFVGNQDS
ncbi:hypothetical protein OGAPHI_000453 [Ogataea philodendri]|uniref:Uncharacterized protein n=1 Tax=Ogataea philodendri TaxID=1378263 RepID=A0A9P8T9V7_9ASCO|nr:uncharacterized protein OGAPHI_000453 [Ogataea philodendri]KAH3671748.1 hypothetical protein OGAPHI_000453 [Ogataea philodendri]